MAPQRSSIYNNNHHVFMSVLFHAILYPPSPIDGERAGRKYVDFSLFSAKAFPSHVVIIMMEIIIL
jgi:hypothetical protein